MAVRVNLYCRRQERITVAWFIARFNTNDRLSCACTSLPEGSICVGLLPFVIFWTDWRTPVCSHGEKGQKKKENLFVTKEMGAELRRRRPGNCEVGYQKMSAKARPSQLRQY